MSTSALTTALTVLLASGASVAAAQGRPRLDSRDLLLAALGTETAECLGTVGPTNYTTATGVLARTFDACVSGDPMALARIDALLAVPFSAQGRADGLSEHYVSTWNAFTQWFPAGGSVRVPRGP